MERVVTVVAAVVAVSTAGARADEEEEEVSAVAPPGSVAELDIPARRFDLRDFGGDPAAALNTAAFEKAVAAIGDAGGGQLYVPPGVYTTTGFALTSHMSLFLEAGATVRGLANFTTVPTSQPVPGRKAADHWRIRNDSCSSYPRQASGPHPPSYNWSKGDVEERNSGYEPLLGCWNQTDVVITGNNGSLEGQADLWWPMHQDSPGLVAGRPHIVLLSRCKRVLVSNITIRDSPFWSVRLWDSRQVAAANLTITATRSTFNNDGIDVDSSGDVLIEHLRYSGGDDAVAIKSGYQQAGATFNQPSFNVIVRSVVATTRASCFCVGSEIQGGSHNISVEGVHCTNSADAIRFKTPTPAHISTDYFFQDISMQSVTTGLSVCGVNGVSLRNISGGAAQAGSFKTCKNVTLADVRITGGGEYSCGSGISGMHPVGVVVPPACST
jgi:polygalacturonase